MGSLSTVAPAAIVTALFPPKVNGLTIPVARAGPRTRGPILAAPNTTGATPKVLSRRTFTLSPGIVTRATMRTVALVILVSPSACCEVPHAVTQVSLAFWAAAAGTSQATASVRNISPNLWAMLSSRLAISLNPQLWQIVNAAGPGAKAGARRLAIGL